MTDLGTIAVSAGGGYLVAAVYLTLPPLPPADPARLPEAARAPYAAWQLHRASLVAGDGVPDMALRDASRADERALLAALAGPLTPEGHALRGQLLWWDALEAASAGTDAWLACVDAGREDCAEPVPDVAPALASWALVPADAEPSLVAWTHLAAAEADPAGAATHLEAARAVPRPADAIAAHVAFAWAEAHLHDDPAAAAAAFAEARDRSPDAALREGATYERLHALAALGHHAELAASALAAHATATTFAPELRAAAVGGLAAAGPEAGALATAAPGDPAVRAAILRDAASALDADGHHTWAAAARAAADALAPGDAAPPLDHRPEDAKAWLARHAGRCGDLAVAPLTGTWDLVARVDRRGRATVEVTGAPGADTPFTACLEGPIPPPEGAVTGAFRARLAVAPRP